MFFKKEYFIKIKNVKKLIKESFIVRDKNACSAARAVIDRLRREKKKPEEWTIVSINKL